MESLETQVTNLTKQVTQLQRDKTIIENYLTTLENQALILPDKTIELQKENFEFRNDIENLKELIDKESQLIPEGTPRIVTRLGTTDVRSSPAPGHAWSGIIRFYMSGEVWNVGTGPAINCKLHVTLYQGTIIANETYIE
ncbi:ELKS/Rab6-interacting/CAST family protein, partial [Candidatus Bathyarchaeota archaeon]|nr:ELKS/Rab6-interacting/CAST family protein [Candidatus Bathyarchaeota archaeon]